MGKRIMVIDDEMAMCQIIKQVLEGEGYHVKTQNQGLLALDDIRNEEFNLVISDVSMPHITGIELLSEIKKLKPDLPVIFVTGQDMEATLQEALRLGLDGFIEKPFNIQAMLEVVKEKMSFEALN